MWVRFPPGPPDPDRQGLNRGATVSLALHAAVLLLLILSLRKHETEVSPAPADFAMVFESASPAAAPPKPQTGQRKPVPPQPAARPTAPHVKPAPAPPVTPPVSGAPRPMPATPQVKPAPPPAAPLPALRQPAPARSSPQPSGQTEQHTASRAPARAGRRQSGAFPSPIMRSFFIPSTTAVSAAHPFSEAVLRGEGASPQARSEERSFDLRGAEALGPDWEDEFMRWVEEHAVYPDQAAREGEDGDSTVAMTIDRYGNVRTVRTTQRSGYTLLDAALTALFRDAKVPPFPPGTPQDSLPLQLTMHYILVR